MIMSQASSAEASCWLVVFDGSRNDVIPINERIVSTRPFQLLAVSF